jgi:Tfp pilus assembly protein PilV
MSLNTQNPANGFILLEVLVAMSLILGVWMTSIGAYQVLALRFKQQESKRSHLRQTFDGYELAEQVRVNNANNKQISPPSDPNIPIKDVKHESSRVSSRNRAVHPATKSTTKNQR